MKIVAIRASVEKAEIIKTVLADLPEWFGLPESTKEYDQTIGFYQSCGFAKLEVFPNLRDEWNPCLIMIKKL